MYFCKVGTEWMSPPDVDYKYISSVLKSFKQAFLSVCPSSPPISPEQFVEMYKGRKRTIYQNALDGFYDTGVLRKHAISSSFVKCEKVKEDSAPRCIQPRDPVYNIGVGCYIKPIEHRVYAAIGRVFEDKVTVVKGFNVAQVACIMEEKWLSFGRPVSIGLDATKFDMHVCAGMLQWEHSIYKALYPGDKELARLLRWQVDNMGVGRCDDGHLKYSVRGRRFSGDMNTALGNCLIMCAMVWTYARERGVEIKLMNNGDDCQVFMEERDEPRFRRGLSEWFFQLGFRMTIEPTVHDLSRVEFCQMKLVHTAAGPVMVRNIDKAREKDSMSIIPLDTEKMFKMWLYAVGECGLALCSGVPIMQSMYMCYMRHGIPSRLKDSVAMETGARMLARGMSTKWAPVTMEARADVLVAWDYTPDEQVALEHYYDKMAVKYSCRPVDDLVELHPAPL
uniref:RNA-directed RNA polymerase n=1 Tax=Riboviria sp. TaxID=2585031 RepID=A0A514D1Y5_9VIRU|nr:MAG: RNA-dependent RNA polymerase [Riboviria sp.]